MDISMDTNSLAQTQQFQWDLLGSEMNDKAPVQCSISRGTPVL